MKTNILLFGVAILPLLGACTNANSEPKDADAVSPPAAEVSTSAPAVAEPLPEANVPMGQVVSTNLMLPETVNLSPAATEIVKMVRSGVDASVMIAYVTNSVNTYSLSADEIVYLNDLGLQPEVVSAMIHHDQRIREASLNGAMAASPATPAPGQSVWNAGAVTDQSNVWQQTAAAPAAETEVQTTVPPPPEEERPSEVTVDYFYDSLAPYGVWIDIPGYGRCWRPTVAVTHSGWRPYADGGRWMWTDYGWYWYSDYSWGWAPFHYGRWFSHPYWGWCWVPGTTWGPSWVSWRYTDAYVGWAPLPPAAYYSPSFGFTYYGRHCGPRFTFGLTWDYFTFVSFSHFHVRHHHHHHRLSRHESARVFNNSTVVNNFIRGDNNTIINQGIGTDRITSVTRSEIPRVNVREQTVRGQSATTIRGTRQEALGADGRTLAVTRHEIPSGRGGVRAGATSVSSSDESGTRRLPPNAPIRSLPTRSESTRTADNAPARQQEQVNTTPRSPFSPVSSAPSRSEAADRNSTVSQPPERRVPDRNETASNPRSLIIRGGQNATAQQPRPPGEVPNRSPEPTATPWLNDTANRTGTRDSRQPTDRSATPSTPAPTRNAVNNNAAPSAPRSTPAPVQQTPRAIQTPTPARTAPVVRSPNSPWQPRTQPSRAVPSGSSFNNPAPVRSAPMRIAPQQQAPAPRSVQPAPAPRIERSVPSRSYSAPAPQRAPSVSPPVRSAPSRIESIPRSAPTRSVTPPSSMAPNRPFNMPAQRSAPAASGNNSSGSDSGRSRPGR